MNYLDFHKALLIKSALSLKEEHSALVANMDLGITKYKYISTLFDNMVIELENYLKKVYTNDVNYYYWADVCEWLTKSSLTPNETLQVRAFLKIKTIIIPKILRNIERLGIILQLSTHEYKYILEEHNHHLANNVLLGTRMSIGKQLSSFKLEIGKRDLEKQVVNWDKSNRLKTLLISQNKPLYNKETNPTGYKYLIFHTDEFYIFWNWVKYKCNVANYKYYSFVATSRIHTIVRTNEGAMAELPTIESILDTRLLGNRQKMLLFSKIKGTYAHKILTITKHGI